MLEKIKDFYKDNKNVIFVSVGLLAALIIWQKTKK